MNTVGVYDVLILIVELVGVTITLISFPLIIKQIKLSVKSTQFASMQTIQERMKSINAQLYTIPEYVVYRSEEFTSSVPHRYQEWKLDDKDKATMEKALDVRRPFFQKDGGSQHYEDMAHFAIGALNDVAECIEDGYIGCKDVMGQYHVQIIRLCHILEPFRAMREENMKDKNHRSEDYGHRILRLRQKAVQYHYMIPKHSQTNVVITNPNTEEKVILFPNIEEMVQKELENQAQYLARNSEINQKTIDKQIKKKRKLYKKSFMQKIT